MLALAFVIEARMIVRRMSKKRAYKNRKQRVRTSAALAVTAFMLFLSEVTSLAHLVTDQDRPITDWDVIYLLISFLAVIFSVAAVIWFPIADMVMASIGDVIRAFAFSLPWSKAKRFRRRMLAQLVQVDSSLRKNQAARLDALISVSNALLLEEYFDPAGLRDIMVTVFEQDPEAHHIDETGEVRRLLTLDPHEPLWGYRLTRQMYDNLVTHAKEIRELRKEIKRQLRRLDRVTRVDSPEFAKLQRANMAAAARIP